MAKTTPMLRQYRRLKARFPDAILLFRLGDFYEMFEEDARLISRQLGLVLTSRRFSKTVRLPMCGVPYRQLTTYVSKLLALGHKVAIADQLEDARKARGLIRRDVVRVITPGTVVEEPLLAEKAQNFLVALAPRRPVQAPREASAWGLAAVDLSTGEFVTAQFEGPKAWSQLSEELDVLQPSELLLPADLIEDEAWITCLEGVRPARLSPVDPSRFDPDVARECLLDHLGVVSLEPYGCEGLPLATAAAGAALHYLQDSQVSECSAERSRQSLAHLRDLETYHPESSVGLDGVTRRNLELTRTLRDGGKRSEGQQGTLLGVLDCTLTAMGARLLRRWIQQPLVDLARIQERLDAVGELSSLTGGPPEAARGEVEGLFLRTDLRDLLDGLHDVERLVGRVGFGTANARDLAALRRTLERIPRIKALLAGARSPRLRALDGDLDDLQDVPAAPGSGRSARLAGRVRGPGAGADRHPHAARALQPDLWLFRRGAAQVERPRPVRLRAPGDHQPRRAIHHAPAPGPRGRDPLD